MSDRPAPAPTDPRRFARRLKRVSTVLAALAFGGFWGLAAGHPVGVTASQSASQSSAALAPAVEGTVPSVVASPAPSAKSTPIPVRRRISNGGSSAPVLSSGSS